MFRFIQQLFRTNLLLGLGVVMCGGWIVVALLAPVFAPYDAVDQDLSVRLSAPDATHWFGTDHLGRDIFSRVIMGSRLSLVAGLITVILALSVGAAYGAVAGYLGKTVDDIMMRLSELVLAFPPIVLAMIIAASLGPSLYNTLLAMVVVLWPNYARVMRSMVISAKEDEYVEAARVIGASHIKIIFREILPNCIGPVLVMATLDIGNAILTFAGLSFLGLGSPPPTPEWGAMVATGVTHFIYWWIGTFPGLAILSVALAANFIGDGLRDYLDPHLSGF
ncbi:MAG: ABC transporter permease [Desulfobacteraceae bacterium]|nr:ABC transporter permease [Desulfobacteraceae bacterium]